MISIFSFIAVVYSTICFLLLAAFVVYDLLEELFLEIKSIFSFPKHNGKFLVKKDNKFVWINK
jgi:predicted Rdx family selenoprotein